MSLKTILVVLTMAGLFLDRPHINNFKIIYSWNTFKRFFKFIFREKGRREEERERNIDVREKH